VESENGASLSTMGAGSHPSPSSKGSAEQIVFLCPNGHKLNGPAKLAGRLGKCPHCDTRFQIPSLEELRAAQQAAAQEEESNQLETTESSSNSENDAVTHPASVAADSNDATSTTSMPSMMPDELETLFAAVREDQVRQIHQRTASASGIGKAGSPSISSLTAGIPQQPSLPAPNHSEMHHPLADLVNRLWEEREHGGIIELHLEGGTVFLPDWFERTLSNKSHGLFAAQAADGTVTMTVVPWDKVARVVIRGVVGLPDGMFE
jgi:hypothetical protein